MTPYLTLTVRLFKIISFILFLSIPLGFATPVLAEQQLTIGWEQWGIYQYKDSTQQLKGLDVELINAISQAAGYSLKWRELPWKRHLHELKAGRIDLAPGCSKNSERETYAFFSIPYRDETVALFVRKGTSANYPFKRLEDLMTSSFRLGMTLGYDYGEKVATLMQNPDFAHHVQQVKTDIFNYKKIERNHINGFLGDIYATPAGLKRLGLFHLVEVHPMKIHSTTIHIMLSKKSVSPATVETFNRAIEEIKSNHTYDKIIAGYLE